MKDSIKKIVIFSLIVIFDVILLLYLLGTFNYKEDINEVKYEKKMIEQYINNIREDYVKIFIKNIKEEKYQKAYDMLTDGCKSKQFENNINSFIDKIKISFFNKEKPEKECLYTAENENKVIVTVLINNIDDYSKMTDDDIEYYSINKIEVNIYEESFFNYRLDIELII